MLQLLLACNAPLLGDSGLDSAIDSEALPGTWPTLERKPSWTSLEDGYATGLGFADVDGDGDGDLVVAYGNDMRAGPLVVYRNEGGQLEDRASWRSEADHYFGHLAVGDLDGDGRDDVVVSRFLGDLGFEEPGGVQVYLNEGGALGELPAWEDSGFHSFSCALGDMDLDGDLDLAVAVGEPYRHDGGLSRVYRNDGGGDFTLAWQSELPRQSFDAAWLDLDADGNLDLAFANIGAPHTLYMGQGNSLESTPAWQAPGLPERFEGNSLDWGDVDGDGLLDLVISDNKQLGGTGSVSLYCGPDLERCWESADEARYRSALSLEDLDGDGDLDLLSGAWGVDDFGGDAVLAYLNHEGTLESTPSWRSFSEGVAEAFGWEDLDGEELLVVEHGGGLGPLPRTRVLEHAAGQAVGDGYVSGAAGRVVVAAPGPRDLAVSNWNKSLGNFLFLRATTP